MRAVKDMTLEKRIRNAKDRLPWRAHGLRGQQVDVGTRVELAGLRMHERMARMPISKPIVPSAFANLVEDRCFQAAQSIEKVSLFDGCCWQNRAATTGLPFAGSTEFDYFSNAGSPDHG